MTVKGNFREAAPQNPAESKAVWLASANVDPPEKKRPAFKRSRQLSKEAVSFSMEAVSFHFSGGQPPSGRKLTAKSCSLRSF
jgi:hypothetical protein